MTQEMTQNGSVPTRPWRPIGELLVDAGVITRAELDEAFFSWFAHESPSRGFGGRYTYLKTFTSPAPGC